MKSLYNEEKTIKQLKETIESLKKENHKLKQENKSISSLKNTILKLQEEKMELSRKLMEMEGEAVLYKDDGDISNEMLYNPRRGSRISTISQKELLLKLQPNSSKMNLANNNKEQKQFNKELNKITNSNFSIISPKRSNILLKDGLKNKNEEILLLKNELVKKEQIITELKKNKDDYNKNSSNAKNALNYSNSNSTNIKQNDKSQKLQSLREDYLGFMNKKFSLKKNYDQKESNDSINEENDTHLLLEKNIYSEIQNILEEKRNFILNTLTRENFSFDLINGNDNIKVEKKKKNELTGKEISGANIEQILVLIRQRKKKVEMTKKYLEEKIN